MTAALDHARIATRVRASCRDALEVQARIERLAASIEASWRAHGFREEAFAEVAHAELRAFLAEHGLRSHELAHWIFSPHHVSTSASASAPSHPSQPQLELYRDARFRIEAAFWFGGLTEIVDHDYAGVMALLEGLAVQRQWQFEAHERLSDEVHRGELRPTTTTLLRAGAMRVIHPCGGPGVGLIEQTMYLDKTCVTLCIRTNTTRPSHCYRPPGLAFVRREPSPVRARQFALLGAMPAKAVTFAAETCATQVIRGGSLLDAIEILGFMSAHGFDPSLLEDVCEQAKSLHGGALALVWRSLVLEREQRVLLSVETGKEARHRLLSFLLIFMPDKAAMLSFLGREYPDDDARALLWEWLLEARRAFGLELDALGLTLLEGLFDESSEAQLLERLEEEYDAQDVADLADDIRRVCHEILGLPILRRLFATVAWKPAAERRAFECSLEPDTLRWLPYPRRLGALEPSFAASLVLNPSCLVQEGNELPVALEGRVPFAESLSSNRPILWVREPTTRYWLPYWLPAADHALRAALQQRALDPSALPQALLRPLYEASILIAPDDADGRIAAWERTVRQARESYVSRGHAILPRLVSPLWVASLRRHYRALHDAGEFSKEREHLGNIAMYLEEATRFLQHQLVTTVSEIVGEEVLPSFCYTRIYGEQAKLDRHTDRPNCVWNISIPLDLTPETEAPDGWPIFVEHDGTAAAIALEMGDGALFRGVSSPHWREPQPAGHRSTFGFVMFAPVTFTGTLY